MYNVLKSKRKFLLTKNPSNFFNFSIPHAFAATSSLVTLLTYQENMKLAVLLVLTFLIQKKGHGLSTRQVSLPFKSVHNSENDVELLKSAFQEVVDSTQFLVQTSPWEKDNNICCVPALGEEVVVQLRANQPALRYSSASGYPSPQITVEATGIEEFGLICLKFYENKELFQDIVDITDLHDKVIDHFERKPPHAGYPANSAYLAGSREIEDLFYDGENTMLELKEKGFLILNNGPKSSTLGHEKLTKYLVDKTDQSNYIRTDTVHFLDRNEAKDCGFEQVRTCAANTQSTIDLNLKSLYYSILIR